MWTLSYMISWSVSRYPETSKQRRHTAPTRETMQVSFQYDKTPRRQKKTEKPLAVHVSRDQRDFLQDHDDRP